MVEWQSTRDSCDPNLNMPHCHWPGRAQAQLTWPKVRCISWDLEPSSKVFNSVGWWQLSCLYKLHYIPGPPQVNMVKAMLPPTKPPAVATCSLRTRQQHQMRNGFQVQWTPLAQPLTTSCDPSPSSPSHPGTTFLQTSCFTNLIQGASKPSRSTFVRI